MFKARYISIISLTAIIAVSASAFGVTKMVTKDTQTRQVQSWTDKAIAYQKDQDSLSKSEYSAVKDYVKVQALSPVRLDHIKTAELMKSEQTCLARAVFYEARSERRSGQIAVAEVVLNRVKSRHYPNSVCGVVYQGSGRKSGCQFSFTCDGSFGDEPKGKAWDNAQKIAAFMKTHDMPPLTNGSTHYHTTAINPAWSSHLRFDRQIGSHKFYRFKFTERPVVTEPSLAIAPPI
ncbi:MAG: cell wall hydrolase [Litorimonas sp.]